MANRLPGVGDKILHEIWPDSLPDYRAGSPRWDSGEDRSDSHALPDDTVWWPAFVNRVDAGEQKFWVELSNGSDWFYRAGDPGWRWPSGNEREEDPPVYTVLVCEGGDDMIPASLALDAVPKGEIWVRRNLRSWPWEQDLFHRLVRRDGGIWMEFKFFRHDQSHRASAWQSEHRIMVI